MYSEPWMTWWTLVGLPNRFGGSFRCRSRVDSRNALIMEFTIKAMLDLMPKGPPLVGAIVPGVLHSSENRRVRCPNVANSRGNNGASVSCSCNPVHAHFGAGWFTIFDELHAVQHGRVGAIPFDSHGPVLNGSAASDKNCGNYKKQFHNTSEML